MHQFMVSRIVLCANTTYNMNFMRYIGVEVFLSKVDFESRSKVDLEKLATASVKLDGPDPASLKCFKK